MLSIVLCFSGLGYCERILQASSSLDRGSDFSCQGCWLGSQGACVSKINCFQGCRWKALYLACEQARFESRANGEEQSDPAGRSLVNRRHKSHFLVLRLRLSISTSRLRRVRLCSNVSLDWSDLASDWSKRHHLRCDWLEHVTPPWDHGLSP